MTFSASERFKKEVCDLDLARLEQCKIQRFDLSSIIQSEFEFFCPRVPFHVYGACSSDDPNLAAQLHRRDLNSFSAFPSLEKLHSDLFGCFFSDGCLFQCNTSAKLFVMFLFKALKIMNAQYGHRIRFAQAKNSFEHNNLAKLRSAKKSV